MAKENTEETRLEAKKSRYSAVSIIMREMYGTKFGYMPGIDPAVRYTPAYNQMWYHTSPSL